MADQNQEYRCSSTNAVTVIFPDELNFTEQVNLTYHQIIDAKTEKTKIVKVVSLYEKIMDTSSTIFECAAYIKMLEQAFILIGDKFTVLDKNTYRHNIKVFVRIKHGLCLNYDLNYDLNTCILIITYDINDIEDVDTITYLKTM